MQLEKYDVKVTKDGNRYEFVSIGNKGSILKVIEFAPINQAETIYNLGFGDVDPLTGNWDDKAVSNNGDRNRVLATVAGSVVDFLNRRPTVTVFAAGSTPLRNILYQRTLERFWNEVAESYEVLGFTESDEWVLFEQKARFRAFLVRRE